MPTTDLRRVDAADRALLERLWLMFRHDLSEYWQALPDADGTFRNDRLALALDDPDRAAYLLSRDAVHELVTRHPGPWAVAFQDANRAAVRFWRRAVTEIVGGGWVEERRPVPERPELPPDVWISFVIESEHPG